jgi:hypothetical protein
MNQESALNQLIFLESSNYLPDSRSALRRRFIKKDIHGKWAVHYWWSLITWQASRLLAIQ